MAMRVTPTRIDEQTFIVNTINFLEQQPEWDSTAVIIAYDDSDGWYDHQMSPIVNQSATAADESSRAGNMCGAVRTRQHCPAYLAPTCARPLRLRSAPALPGHFALREGELSWTTPSPINVPSCASSRTTGSAESAFTGLV